MHGFLEPTPVQELAIEPALAGKDIVATAQTGTGKTLAFVLPMIQLLESSRSRKGIRGVILTPTRELALQISQAFAEMSHGLGIRAVAVVGGMSESTQLTSIRKGAQVLIATPGRLCDFLSRELVDLSGAAIVVLDEADRMLDMGFLPAVKRILAALPAERQTLLFSATVGSSVKRLVESQVRNAVRIEVGSTTQPAEKIDLHLYEVEPDRKLELLKSMLREEEGSFLVFSRTKHGADRLAKRLAQDGVKVTAIHGNRSQNQRNQSLRAFQDGYYRVLVATDVAARGLHVEGIAHVVNYDLPMVPEDFIHRVGRTGRAGARGTASTFASRSERAEVGRIERLIQMQMVRRGVPADLAREQHSPAPVIPIAPPFRRKPQNLKTFTPRPRRRHV